MTRTPRDSIPPNPARPDPARLDPARPNVAALGSPASVPSLAAVIAEAADRGALGATAPALLLEVQAQLGLLAALAAQLTERGRRPFRPDGTWADALARLTFSVYNLADQTGVDVDAAARALAQQVIHAHPAGSGNGSDAWPVPDA